VTDKVEQSVTEWFDEADRSYNPDVSYNLACHLARVSTMRSQELKAVEAARKAAKPEKVLLDPALSTARGEADKADAALAKARAGTREEGDDGERPERSVADYERDVDEARKRVTEAQSAVDTWDETEKSTVATVADLQSQIAKLDADIVSHLKRGIVKDVDRDFARSDPELTAWRKANETEFAKLVKVDPPEDYWSIEPFATHKDSLVAGGVSFPRRLHTHLKRDELRVFLEMQDPPFDRLTDLSRLFAAAEDAPAEPTHRALTVELLTALIAAGVGQPDDIPGEWTTKAGLESKPDFFTTVNDAVSKYEEAFTHQQLATWLKAVKAWKG
jgi:hypothetical protein